MTYFQVLLSQTRAALTGKHDTLVRRAPCQPGALRIHLTRLSTEGMGPRHGEVRRAHQMLNAALLRQNLLLPGAPSFVGPTQVYVSAKQHLDRFIRFRAVHRCHFVTVNFKIPQSSRIFLRILKKLMNLKK